MMIRPVFDPAIPVEVRGPLADLGQRLPSASGAPTALPGWGRRAGRDVARAIGLGAVCALLPVVLAGMFGLAGRIAAVTAQVVLAAVWCTSAWFTGDLCTAMIVTVTVQLACTVSAFVRMDAWQLRQGARRAHSNYLVGDDFDPESRVMLARAQAAIAAVTGSATAAAGLLDDVANNVVLSRQEWEIAQVLARRPGRGGGNTGLVAKRIEALERYAGQVRKADEALAERHAPSAVAGPAESVALAEIDDLAENARWLTDAIRAAPHASGQAGASAAEPRQGDQ
ncbi:hypothetical protein [Actinomadura sp. DC4]|uniref:hypothetical protein n=1 Tax=Actinomadura sp. DC4 TaxID=3055069 RepID=UPI0025B09C79|nr:hypothetical protein [Actinomadura sp. DC4]MDN3360071.1 hypothetical protein [Actinomadura sp. DC4]